MISEASSRAFFARLTCLGIAIGMGLLAAIAFLVVLQVAARNLFDMGLPWADELARFCCIGMVFLATPALAGRRVMVSVSMLPDAMNAAVRKWMILFADITTLVFSGFLLWGFAEFLPRAGKFLTPAMGVPNWFYYSLALCGSLLLAAIAITRITATLTGRDPSAPYHETRDETGLPI
ncbi:Tripartite ATP-independent transporter, DctQ component [Pacificibacter marinus]|uniref:TRAP transporter small permease protein n=2 Tax=Pacificibacter marinus TaxID=658057 RepID=A0A1Y5TQB5_9RHOB|nr:Tripartite ATP-independent transporter, DctQ component [Pacificibacter marinus]SLN69601.1 Tripartite ATP-independent periplasmic transporters, DctQ component [Pacificibacter marinus]